MRESVQSLPPRPPWPCTRELGQAQGGDPRLRFLLPWPQHAGLDPSPLMPRSPAHPSPHHRLPRPRHGRRVRRPRRQPPPIPGRPPCDRCEAEVDDDLDRSLFSVFFLPSSWIVFWPSWSAAARGPPAAQPGAAVRRHARGPAAARAVFFFSRIYLLFFPCWQIFKRQYLLNRKSVFGDSNF